MKLISEERLAELLRAEAYATALEYHNVDEWDYYENALREPLFNNETYWDYVSQSDRDITKDFQSV